MRTRNPTRFLFPALLIVLCGAPAGARVRSDIQVEVWEIRATKSNNIISPELRPIIGQLKRLGQYTGFTLVGKHSKRVPLHETFVAKLTAQYRVRVTPTNHDGRRMQMKVEIKRLIKKKINTIVTMKAGEMQLLGGWTYPRSTDAMIIGIRAR